jgi:hypothetical protein
MLRRQTYEGDMLQVPTQPRKTAKRRGKRPPSAPRKKRPVVSRLTPDEYRAQIEHERDEKRHKKMMDTSTDSVYSHAEGVDLNESRMESVVGDKHDPRSDVSDKPGEVVRGGRKHKQSHKKRSRSIKRKSHKKRTSKRRHSKRRRR